MTSTLSPTSSAASSLSAFLALSVCKPVLESVMFLPSTHSKFSKSLPEYFEEWGGAGKKAAIQITNSVDLASLLCLNWKAKRKEQGAKCKANEFFPHVYSTALSCSLPYALCSMLPAIL